MAYGLLIIIILVIFSNTTHTMLLNRVSALLATYGDVRSGTSQKNRDGKRNLASTPSEGREVGNTEWRKVAAQDLKRPSSHVN